MENREFDYFIRLLYEVSDKYHISEEDSKEIIDYVYKHIELKS